MKIPTKGPDGQPNGWLLPLWNVNDAPELRPEQVYVTAVAPHSQKGPHCHRVRRGLFVCIKGDVRIVLRANGAYKTHQLGERFGYGLLCVSPGVPACIYNDGDTEALVINLPAPAWSAEQPDEWPVEEWNP